MNAVIRCYALDAETTGSESDGVELQRLLTRLTHDQIVRTIDSVLERCSSPNDYLYLDRLSIDVGSLELAQLESELPKRIAANLERALADVSASNVDDSRALIAGGGNYRQSRQQTVNDALLFFLMTGRLPWSFRLPAGQNLEQVLTENWRDNESALGGRHFSKALIGVLRNDAARVRLLRQFSTGFVARLLVRYFPETAVVFEKIRQGLTDSVPPAIAEDDRLRTVVQNLLVILSSGQAVSQTMLNEIGAIVKDRYDADYAPDRHIEVKWQHQDSRRSDSASRSQTPATHRQEVEPLAHSLFPVDDSDIAEGVYVDNAGLVLLHPFLPQLFTASACLQDYKIVKTGRALALLHYLSTAETVAHEYDLVLPKVLCNIDLPVPVETLTKLNLEERSEADELLTAVVKHWDVLRNTSIDSLRATFILRPGKLLRRGDGDWQLHVEYRSCDILLDSLPWNIATIKLPWMQNLLWVEWSL
ncbi:contractile injection system tape measure protein [Methylotuvimicrobium sp. KM1]|uniref:contractile injection system tape measure protein n=1 Tax=Methylotuvimicrobium sp. KM1 TaxID=3377707 RepID=UPI0038511309